MMGALCRVWAFATGGDSPRRLEGEGPSDACCPGLPWRASTCCFSEMRPRLHLPGPSSAAFQHRVEGQTVLESWSVLMRMCLFVRDVVGKSNLHFAAGGDDRGWEPMQSIDLLRN